MLWSKSLDDFLDTDQEIENAFAAFKMSHTGLPTISIFIIQLRFSSITSDVNRKLERWRTNHSAVFSIASLLEYLTTST